MKGGIFLIRDDDELVELASVAYESEDLLQGLLERYPKQSRVTRLAWRRLVGGSSSNARRRRFR